MRRFVWIIVAVAVLAGGALALIGGREGALLLYVKHVQRKEPLPNQAVA